MLNFAIMRQSLRIAPSILAADFARLGEAVAAAEAAGVEQIHIDVMDGHFVPNISMGPVVVKSLRRVTDLPIDVHLMITEPERYLEAFADAGANALTAHVEATPHIHRVLQQTHSLGLRAGVTLNPGTSVTTLEDVLDIVDLVLVMSVNPGFGGQSFIPGSLKKIRRVAEMLDAIGSNADIAVDGGVDVDTAGAIVAAGANVLIAGSAIYRAKIGVAAAVHNLRQAAATQIGQQPG